MKLCECGCGQQVTIAKSTNNSAGRIRGELCRFLQGHGRSNSTPERGFWKHVIPKSVEECWNWTGYVNAAGYGQFRSRNVLFNAHRVSWEIHNGPIPEGMFVCHRCDNPACVNPNHLFLGFPADNVHDMDNKGRRVNSPQYSESHGMSKLSSQQVIEIRQLASDNVSYAEIGRRYNISDVHAGRIAMGRCRNFG